MSHHHETERRVYVGRLDRKTRDRDVEDLFGKYGKVVRVDMKNGYAFVEFDDDRDAEDAIKALDGSDLDGSRIIVEQCHGGKKRNGGDDECYNCGGRGHWARDCRSRPRRGGGDRGGRYNDRGGRYDDRDRDRGERGRCYICDEYGHMARDCRNKRRSSRSRSRSASRSPRRRDSRSRSRSPRPSSRSDRRSESPKRENKEENGNRSSPPPAGDSNGKRVSRSRSRSPPPNNE